MYARVTTWEGANADGLRRAAAEMQERAPSGPPPGVPAVGLTMLVDPDSGRSLAISLFETEEDLRKGDAALDAMNPENDDAGRRVSVERFEVAVDIRI